MAVSQSGTADGVYNLGSGSAPPLRENYFDHPRCHRPSLAVGLWRHSLSPRSGNAPGGGYQPPQGRCELDAPHRFGRGAGRDRELVPRKPMDLLPIETPPHSVLGRARRLLRLDFMRFLLVGALNTVFGYVICLAGLSLGISPGLALAIAAIVGGPVQLHDNRPRGVHEPGARQVAGVRWGLRAALCDQSRRAARANSTRCAGWLGTGHPSPGHGSGFLPGVQVFRLSERPGSIARGLARANLHSCSAAVATRFAGSRYIFRFGGFRWFSWAH